ncbi:MAG: NAD-dependent protein deacetylase [Pseudomonadota bacterium]
MQRPGENDLSAVSGPADSIDPRVLDRAVAALTERFADYQRLLVLSGAGLSTASGIGDYRDHDGNYKRPPPVTIQRFLESTAARQRYWARSLFGWPAFAAARPNPAHLALARWEAALRARGGWLKVITQNVDGLHQAAGHNEVIELHGSLHDVGCLDCGAVEPRAQLQHRLLAENPQLMGTRATLAPDGDADLEDVVLDSVSVPQCLACGGRLKPTVVFFGDSVPRAAVESAYRWVEAADALLIVGSSVMIHSSFRFCRRARDQSIPLVAINRGKTRADSWLEQKFEVPCEALLPRAVNQLYGS